MADSGLWTNGKPFVLTAEQIRLRWGGYRRGKLICRLCGHVFTAGDTARFIYGNTKREGAPQPQAGNFFTCEKCDGEDVLVRADVQHTLAVTLAKQWNIYGPDWQEDMQR